MLFFKFKALYLKSINLFFIFLFSALGTFAQEMYFPPQDGSYWKKSLPASHNFCQDKIHELFDFLEQTNTDAFILLINGEIVIEKYFNSFKKESSASWGTSSETLAAFLLGIAASENLLSTEDPSEKYLGNNWASGSAEFQKEVKLKHHISMTSGLQRTSPFLNCITPECLKLTKQPGAHWEYNEANFPIILKVIESASNQTANRFLFEKLRGTIGMTGSFDKKNNNGYFVSNAQSMARFGLLLLNEGVWDNLAILGSADYFKQMTSPSQSMNNSYGYFTWLNGQKNYIHPSNSIEQKGPISKTAPKDLYTSIGENDQLINVVPSQKMVWVRLGKASKATKGVADLNYNDEVWEKIQHLKCKNKEANASRKTTSPSDFLKLTSKVPIKRIMVSDESGKIHYAAEINSNELNIALSNFDKGAYFAKILFVNDVVSTKRFTVN